MSTFGGPEDRDIRPDQGLKYFDKADLEDPKFAYLFLPTQPPGTSGLGRRLNPDSYYVACRWDEVVTPRELLRNSLASVENLQTGRAAEARPVDWRPNQIIAPVGLALTYDSMRQLTTQSDSKRQRCCHHGVNCLA